MMYPEYLVTPMREELTRVGFEELKDADAVTKAIESEGTVFVMVNSVCGCAAANARPAARLASQNAKHPDKMVTVFAGMEAEAVNKARAYMLPYPPSSPAMALFKDGKLVHMIERHQIEGRPAQMIADNLMARLINTANEAKAKSIKLKGLTFFSAFFVSIQYLILYTKSA